MKYRVLLALVAGCLGCRQESALDVDQLRRTTVELQSQITALQKRLPSPTGAFDDLIEESASSQFRALSNRVAWAESGIAVIRGESLDWTSVDVTKPNYQPVITRVGILLVAIQDSTPYLDGYRIAMQIGNPTSADLRSVRLHIRSSNDLQFTNLAAYNESVRERTEDMAEVLKAGCWSPATFTLTPATPERVRNISLALETKEVVLRSVGK